jgi:hypothetical protein
MKKNGRRKPVDPAGHVPVEIEAERRDPELMALRKAQADQDRQADERCMAVAIQRFDEFLRTTSTERLPKLGRGGSIQTDDGYLVVRKAAGSGFLSAWPVLLRMLDAELEVRRGRADGLNVVRRLDKVVLGTEQAAVGKPDRKQIEDERLVGAAEIRRESMLLPVWAMKGPVGKALHLLHQEDPDAFQIVNLRKERIDGKLMTFREIAKRFRRKGAEGKEYTPQRCQQICKQTVLRLPALKGYIDGNLLDASTGKLPEDRQTDRDWIEARTTESALDPADYGRGIHGASRNSRIRD